MPDYSSLYTFSQIKYKLNEVTPQDWLMVKIERIRDRMFPKGYTPKQYKDYLNSSIWKEKQRFMLKIKNYKCEICESPNSLTVHHITYKNIEHENLDELAVLCASCHFTSHNRKHHKVVRPSAASSRLILSKRMGYSSDKMKLTEKLFFNRKINLFRMRGRVPDAHLLSNQEHNNAGHPNQLT